MKYLIAGLFISQVAIAQIATNGGFQTPIQMSVNTLSSVFKAIKSDAGLMLWSIKNISANNNMVKVEFITETKTCAALLYKVTITADEDYQAVLATDAIVACSN